MLVVRFQIQAQFWIASCPIYTVKNSLLGCDAVLPDGVVWHQIGVISYLMVSKFFNGVLVSNLDFWCPKYYELKL